MKNKEDYSIIKLLEKQWNKNWPDYVIQFVFLGVILLIITANITESLKPRTDIEVYKPTILKIDNESTDYQVDIKFHNKANFAGEDFYLYVWGITVGGWVNDYPTSEHCEIIRDLEVDYQHRVKIHCDFIPPNSEFIFSFSGTQFDNEANKTGKIALQWWSKTTPLTEKQFQIDQLFLK